MSSSRHTSTDESSLSTPEIKDKDDEKEQTEAKKNQDNKKRDGYITWNEYFMGVASLASQQCEGPNGGRGACIINKDKRIVGVGFDKMPKKSQSTEDDKYLCHAELNAYVNRNTSSLKHCTLYITDFPCNECAKLIIQSGIDHIVYCRVRDEEDERTKAARLMFERAEISSRIYKPENNIKINFETERSIN